MGSRPASAVEQSIILASDADVELEILLTDTGNARRLKEEYGHECRFCREEKIWYVWNPKLGVWRVDPLDLQMQFRAKLTFQKLRNQWRSTKEELEPQLDPFRDKLTKKLECKANRDLLPEEQKTLAGFIHASALEQWYTQSENAERINKAIKMLCSEPEMTVHVWQFDADPYLFNCKNGTFDLRESTITREHRREDFCSLQAPVDYEMFLGADERPLFEAFIKRIMPIQEKREYLQRFFGLCLSGITDERTMLLLLGQGANGKGVLIRLLCGVLGEEGGYAAMAAPNSFLQTKSLSSDETRNDLVALIGKRFVAVSETNKKATLNSALLKCFAGGDGDLRIRGNYETLRAFTPKGKLVLATNNEPRIDDDSDGMWDRVVKVWFEVQIPRGERDVDLVNKILATERSGVLAWMLEGWAAYLEDRAAGDGLPRPASISSDTEQYRDAQSQMSTFVEDCYEIVPLTYGPAGGLTDGIKSSDVYTTYKAWLDRTGERDKKSQKSLSLELEKWGARHGVRKREAADGKYWYGLRSKDAPADHEARTPDLGLDPR